MADKGKKKFKFEMSWKLDELCKFNDLHKESQSALQAAKGLKPLSYKIDAELDERKWNEKKLKEEAYYAFKMALIMLDKEVKKIKGDEKELKKAYDDFLKDADYGLEKFVKDLESGKADNAKALKDGKSAFAKLDGVEFKGAFENPRKAALDALNPLTKGDKADAKEGAKSLKALETAKGKLDEVGKDAESAINFLMKTAKQTKNDKDVDPELKKFAEEIFKYEDEFETFLSAADDLTGTFDQAINALKKGAIEPGQAKEFCEMFQSLKPLEKHAQTCVQLAKKLKPQFKKIEKKLG